MGADHASMTCPLALSVKSDNSLAANRNRVIIKQKKEPVFFFSSCSSLFDVSLSDTLLKR